MGLSQVTTSFMLGNTRGSDGLLLRMLACMYIQTGLVFFLDTVRRETGFEDGMCTIKQAGKVVLHRKHPDLRHHYRTIFCEPAH